MIQIEAWGDGGVTTSKLGRKPDVTEPRERAAARSDPPVSFSQLKEQLTQEAAGRPPPALQARHQIADRRGARREAGRRHMIGGEGSGTNARSVSRALELFELALHL